MSEQNEQGPDSPVEQAEQALAEAQAQVEQAQAEQQDVPGEAPSEAPADAQSNSIAGDTNAPGDVDAAPSIPGPTTPVLLDVHHGTEDEPRNYLDVEVEQDGVVLSDAKGTEDEPRDYLDAPRPIPYAG